MSEETAEQPATEYVSVGKLQDFTPGAMKAVKVDGREIAVVQMEDRWHAFANYCPHAFAPMSSGWIANGQIFCAFHLACFDLATGAHVSGPAWDGLTIYEIRVEGDDVQVAKPPPPEGRPPHLRFVSRSDDRWKD